jgi:uncharacterized membrane protein YpjA
VFIFNLLGTAYGYYWYKNQLADVWKQHPKWLSLFVPDSPTATLFFVVALGFVLFPILNRVGWRWKSLIESIAVISSIKYGLWAVSIILMGAFQGVELGPIDFMLMGSHLIMAIQVLVYIQLFNFNHFSIVSAAVITLFSDFVDYFFGVYPWLSAVLMDDLLFIRNFTISLSLLAIALSIYLIRSK